MGVGSTGAAMAKRKKQAPKSPDARVIVIVLKDTPDYRDWVQGLTRATLIPTSSIIRDALADWAAKRNLPTPPQSVGQRGRPRTWGTD